MRRLPFADCRGLSLSRASSIAVSEAQPKPKVLPQSAFRPEKLSYDAIGTDLFTLNYTPPKMQLPDLRKLLTYYGPNGRPDANLDSKAVHFGLANNHEQGAMAPGDRLYLLYDRTQHPPRYTFSPGNSPTTLWIEIEPEDESASVSVYMVNEEGGDRPGTEKQGGVFFGSKRIHTVQPRPGMGYRAKPRRRHSFGKAEGKMVWLRQVF
jgi:hypothetical protein